MSDSHAVLAAEIDRLRQALARIDNLGPAAPLAEAKRIAREALDLFQNENPGATPKRGGRS